MKLNHGGTIYYVPSEAFSASPQKELEGYEMVSKTAVKPIKKETYKTSLAAMCKMGVRVYFVNEKVFKRLHFISDKRFSEITTTLTLF